MPTLLLYCTDKTHEYYKAKFDVTCQVFSNEGGILLTGDDSGRGGILMAEGQETLFMAKSLLEALVRAITDASVTIEVLLLLKNYKQGFLELLKTTSPVINESGSSKMLSKEEIEQSLTERIEEVEEFQAAKVKVSSFIRMCDVIQPGGILRPFYPA